MKSKSNKLGEMMNAMKGASKEDVRDALETLEFIHKEFPFITVMARRLYNMPQGYLPYQRMMEFLSGMISVAAMMLKPEKVKKLEGYAAYRNSVTTACVHTLKEFDFPFYVIDKNLFETLKLTEVPKECPVEILENMPFPSMIFLVPPGSMTVIGNPIEMFIVSVNDSVRSKDGFIQTWYNHSSEPPEGARTHLNTIFCSTKGGYLMLDLVANLESNSFRADDTHRAAGLSDPGDYKGKELDGSNLDMGDAFKAVMSLCLLIGSSEVKSLESVESSSRRPDGFVKKAKSGREIWNPRVMGKGTRPPKEQVSGPSGEKGTHRSPRYHWKGRHWKLQPYGPGRSLRKAIRIEPYQVGLKSLGAEIVGRNEEKD